MSPEFEGILKKGCGWLPRRATFYISAVWVGCQISGPALAVGVAITRGKIDNKVMELLTVSPMLLGGGLFCLNIFVLTLAFRRFLQRDNLNPRDWGIFAGAESVLTLCSFLYLPRGWLAYTATFSLWLVLMAMLGLGSWFMQRRQLERITAEFELLKSQNHARRIRRELRGDPSVSLPSPEDRDKM